MSTISSLLPNQNFQPGKVVSVGVLMGVVLNNSGTIGDIENGTFNASDLGKIESALNSSIQSAEKANPGVPVQLLPGSITLGQQSFLSLQSETSTPTSQTDMSLMEASTMTGRIDIAPTGGTGFELDATVDTTTSEVETISREQTTQASASALTAPSENIFHFQLNALANYQASQAYLTRDAINAATNNGTQAAWA